MAASSTPRIFALVSGADLSAKQFAFMKHVTDDEHCTFCVAGEASIGVLQNLTTANGDLAEVAFQGGGGKLKLGGTVARGDYLKSDANGFGVVASADKDKYGAKAMASGVSGDVIPVEVIHGERSI